MTVRPCRPDVAARYDLGVDAYDSLWSPVILPPAQAVVSSLELEARWRVLDVGVGSGALIPTIRAAAAGVRVVGLDPSVEMLRRARVRTGVPVLQADALALPVIDTSIHAVLVAFVLFHLCDPAAAVAEIARVLRGGGRVGSVTWTQEATLGAYEAWDATLSEGGASPLPPSRVDAGLNSPGAIDALFTAADLRPRRIWLERLTHQWEPSTYWRLVTGSGVNRTRLQRIDASARTEVLARARERLAALSPRDYAWSGEVVCAVAIKPG